MTNVTVRVARVSDRPRIEEVYARAFATVRPIYRPTPDAERQQARQFYQGIRLVAEVEGKIAGTAQVTSHARYFHISGLAVDPDDHRKGIARAMIEWIVAAAEDENLAFVLLDTIQQTGNVDIFEKLGFQAVAEDVPTWCVSDRFPQLTNVSMKRMTSIATDPH